MLRGKGSVEDARPQRRQSATNAQPGRALARPSQSAFRRNRTLTGSSSAIVRSTSELNAEFKSPRAHVHHLTSVRRKLLLLFGAFTLGSAGLYVLLSQIVAVPVVAVDGVIRSDDNSPSYSQTIDSYYAARPIERLRFLLDTTVFLSHIQASHPEIADVEITGGSAFGEATVDITPRKPIARWTLSDGERYVDESGVVFTVNYFDVPELAIVDNSGLATDSVRLIASNRFLGFVGQVVSASNDRALAISTVSIPPLTTRQVAITLQDSETEYRLSIDRSAGEQVEDITRLSGYMSANNIQPEYIDVRLKGKAFYK